MNKTYVFVSGAAGGIGSETVNLLAQRGFQVFAADIDERVFEIFSDQKIVPIKVDITNDESIKAAVTKIRQITDYLNGVVNIAGVFDQFALVEAQPESFKRLIDTNLVGAQLLTSALFPLLKNARGRVINLSSETVLAQLPLQSYGLSKKLFDTWNTQLRMELALLDMKSIIIRAGGHQTPFINQSQEIINRIDQKSNYQRLFTRTKEKAQSILSKKQADPAKLATVIYQALTDVRPKNTYHVNISLLLNMLSLLPARIREVLVVWQLKKWM